MVEIRGRRDSSATAFPRVFGWDTKAMVLTQLAASLSKRPLTLGMVLFLVTTMTAFAGAPPQAETEFDILIRGGQVFGPSGEGFSPADVGVKDGRIVRIGSLKQTQAGRTISAEGLYVVPGFIDMHVHAERGLSHPELAPAAHYLKQGVTSLVIGADGYGAWPLHETIEDQIQRFTRQGIGVNVALLVGHDQVRRQVIGLEDRAPTKEELARMRHLVREAMEAGAQGISSGLAYAPGQYATTEEVIELVKEVTPYRGTYHTHIRDEADELMDAVSEAIRIAEESGVVSVITHFKAMYRRNWGKVRPATGLIEEARARGVEVFADQYPFTEHSEAVPLIPPATWWGSSGFLEERATRLAKILEPLPDDHLVDLYAELASLVSIQPGHKQFLQSLSSSRLLQEMITPALSLLIPAEGASLQALYSWPGANRATNPEARKRFLERLADLQNGAEIRLQVEEYISELGGPDNIVILDAARPALEKKTLQQATQVLGKTVVDTAIQLGLEDAQAIFDVLSQQDVEYVMRKDYVATISDGDFPYFGTGAGKIGVAQLKWSYAAFPTKIREYAIERQVVSLAHALRSCTSLPAKILGWKDRGVLQEGYWADITVFDPKGIRPKSTLKNVHQYSEGVEYVLVNGKLAVDQSRPTRKLAGRIVEQRRE